MAKRLTHVPTDDSLRETTQHGSAAFPFEYYIDEVMNFDGHAIEWHWHTELEWLYMERGSLDCCIGTERITMQEGDGMFINSRVIHHFEGREPSIMPNVLFLPTFIAVPGTTVYEEWVKPVLESETTYVLLRKDSGQAEPVLRNMRQLFAYADEEKRDSMLVWMKSAEMLHCFVQEYRDRLARKANRRDMLLQSRMRQMMQYIQDHYVDKVTLEQISQAANVSRSEALRCFHEQLQKTPVEYLIEFRLARAREMLVATDDSISRIAASVGMENSSYFVRAFRKQYGMTPSMFRKNNIIHGQS